LCQKSVLTALEASKLMKLLHNMQSGSEIEGGLESRGKMSQCIIDSEDEDEGLQTGDDEDL
jgi:hypothetical protein